MLDFNDVQPLAKANLTGRQYKLYMLGYYGSLSVDTGRGITHYSLAKDFGLSLSTVEKELRKARTILKPLMDTARLHCIVMHSLPPAESATRFAHTVATGHKARSATDVTPMLAHKSIRQGNQEGGVLERLCAGSAEVLPASRFQKRLETAPDFLTACQIAAAHYKATALSTRKSWKEERPDEAYPEPAFWDTVAEEAADVVTLYTMLLHECPPTARTRALAILGRQEAYAAWYAALCEDTGEAYAEHLGF